MSSTHTITAPASPASYTATYEIHADLSLGMTAAPPEVCEGDPITYTLSVANAGLSQAASVSVRCLEKDRERRFHSAHGIVFALEEASSQGFRSFLRTNTY